MIETNKKIIFTDSAKMRLEKLHIDIDAQIETYLKDRKNVPGDDFIEITASDIDELSYRLRIIRPTRTNSRQLILYVYAIMGMISTIIGLFYTQIKTIIFEDKERLIFILGGLLFTTTALVMSYMYKLKERKEQDILDYEREKMKYNEFKSKYKDQ